MHNENLPPNHLFSMEYIDFAKDLELCREAMTNFVACITRVGIVSKEIKNQDEQDLRDLKLTRFARDFAKIAEEF